MLTLAGASCLSHHSICTGTDSSGRAAKASEQKLDAGAISAAETSSSLKRSGGVEMSVSRVLYTQVATISSVLMVLVCLLYSLGITETSLAHFSVLCHFHCGKARIYRRSLSLHIKSRVCKAKRMWNWRKKHRISQGNFSLCGRDKRTKGSFICKSTEFEKQVLSRKV